MEGLRTAPAGAPLSTVEHGAAEKIRKVEEARRVASSILLHNRAGAGRSSDPDQMERLRDIGKHSPYTAAVRLGEDRKPTVIGRGTSTVKSAGSAGTSVIIPTRNRAGLIGRAIQSVLAQSMPAHEIIVVDDASTDSTREVVEQIRSPIIRYEVQSEWRGAAAARNTGLRSATGEFVAFLDDDDEWLPKKLELQHAALQGAPDGTRAVFSGVFVVSGRTNRVEKTWIPHDRPLGLADFLNGCPFGSSIPLLKQSALIEVGGFDEDLSGSQDRDLFIRLSELSPFIPVRDALVRYYVHGDQITTDLATKIRSTAAIVRKHRSRYLRHPKAHARQLQRLGMLYCANARHDEGRACFEESLAIDPSRSESQDHLTRSQRDPESHRRYLVEEAFRSYDGITLFV